MGFNNNFNSMGGATVLTDLEVDGTTLVVDETNNRVGIGDGAPGTTLQVKGTAPYVTIQNSTSENTAGGCESKLIFEDHGNNALGQIEVSHVGSSDDEKGQLIIKTNNDSGLQTALTINEAQKATFSGIVDVDSSMTVDPGSTSGTGLTLTHTDIDALAMSVVASNTTADVLSVTANSLTSGKVISGQTSAATGIALDQNYTLTTASSTVGLDIDFDKTGTSTSDNTMIGINVDMDNTAATNGTNTMVGVKLTPTLQHASAAGTTLVKGLEVTATGSGPGNTTTRALDLVATGADFNQGVFMKIDNGGPDIKMLSSADNADFCTVSTGASGEVTIATTDGGGAAGHINLEPDGDVVIKGATPKLIIGDAGAEDTMLVFDGNAADFRVGIDDGTDTLEIGKGTAHGTDAIIKIDSTTNLQLLLNSAVLDGEYSGDLAMFTAGEDLTAGEVVYLKAADSKMWKAVATASATSRCVAMCLATTSANAMGPFLLRGFARFDSEFPTYTVGGALFTPEAETSGKNVPEQAAPDTDGDFVQVIGFAISADAVYFNPSNDIIEVA
jgi:hypothetical protein